MAVFADHGVSLSVYKIVCVCWFGIILSCLDNIGQFAQVIGETVGFGQIVHHDSRISFMSILGCCVTTVSEVSLCVAVWSLSFKISRRRSPTAVGFKQWSNFATQDGLMMAGTGFHSLSLFGDILPALPRPLLDQRQDETCSLRKRA